MVQAELERSRLRRHPECFEHRTESKGLSREELHKTRRVNCESNDYRLAKKEAD